MTCGLEDDETLNAVRPPPLLQAMEAQLCSKCSSEPSIGLIRCRSYCQNCYLQYFPPKFRSSLMNSIPSGSLNNSRHVFAFSNSIGSRACLSLLKGVMFGEFGQEAIQKLGGHVKISSLDVVWIDERLLPPSLELEGSTLNSESSYFDLDPLTLEIQTLVQDHGFKFHALHLEDVYGSPWKEETSLSLKVNPSELNSKSINSTLPLSGIPNDDNSPCCHPDSPSNSDPSNVKGSVKGSVKGGSESTWNSTQSQRNRNRILLMDSLTSLSATSQASLLQVFRSQLLVQFTQYLSASTLILSESLNRLAKRTLSEISLGRGASLPYEVGRSVDLNLSYLCKDDGDSCSHQLSIKRPISEFLDSDLSLFLQLLPTPWKESSPNHPFLTSNLSLTPSQVKSSLQSLTDNFLNDLQSQFPATSPTIVRTSQKLINTPQSLNPSKDLCILCRLEWRSNQENGQHHSTIHNLTKACTISSPSTSPFSSSSSSSSSKLPLDLMTFLCHSCQNLGSDLNQVHVEKVKRSLIESSFSLTPLMTRKVMEENQKSLIKEYLL